MAVLIHAEGGSNLIYPKNGVSFTVDELQDMIGEFEYTHTYNGNVMIIDRYENCLGLAENVEATRLWLGPLREVIGNTLFGDVLLIMNLVELGTDA